LIIINYLSIVHSAKCLSIGQVFILSFGIRISFMSFSFSKITSSMVSAPATIKRSYLLLPGYQKIENHRCAEEQSTQAKAGQDCCDY